MPGYDTSSWFAFFVPAKTPAEIIKKMHADTVAVLAEPQVKTKLDQLGVVAVGSTPEALGTHLRSRDGQVGARHQGRQHQGQRMISRRRAAWLAATATLAPAVVGRAFSQPAPAQGWPNRFVRLIVPFPPGGGTDAIARVLAAKLSDIWGQQLVIENRGGGATNIGTEAVVRADPDGYTMLFQSMPLAVNRFLFPSLNYDAVADLAPVSLLVRIPQHHGGADLLAGAFGHGFIAYAKANPGKVTFASSGHGTSVHLSGELFKRMAGIEMMHVPYRGAGPALNDLHPRPRRRHVQQYRRGAAAHSSGQAAWARGDDREALAGGAGTAADRGGRRAGLRRVVLVCALRAREDAARDHSKDACRHRRRARRPDDQGSARAARRRGRRLDAGRARPLISRPKWTNGGRSSRRPASASANDITRRPISRQAT